jgi:threonine/homoserine/homoserine lactone efflux protein
LKVAIQQLRFKLGTSNPKAILIFTAFLPQFVDSTHAIAPQFVVLGALWCWNGSPLALTPTWACTCAAGSPGRRASGCLIVAVQAYCQQRRRYF